jgi:hypothetical protein
MRLLRVCVFVFLLGALLGFGVSSSAQGSYPSEYTTVAAVTDTSQLLTFGFNATHITLVNDGTNEVFFSFSPTATTSKFRINSGESISAVLASPSQGVALICSPSETASVRVGAWR